MSSEGKGTRTSKDALLCGMEFRDPALKFFFRGLGKLSVIIRRYSVYLFILFPHLAFKTPW